MSKVIELDDWIAFVKRELGRGSQALWLSKEDMQRIVAGWEESKGGDLAKHEVRIQRVIEALK